MSVDLTLPTPGEDGLGARDPDRLALEKVQALRRQENFSEAFEKLDKLEADVRYNPDDGLRLSVKKERDDLLEAQKEFRDRWDRVYENARESRQWSKARGALEKLLRAFPEDGAAYRIALGEIDQQERDQSVREAIDICRERLEPLLRLESGDPLGNASKALDLARQELGPYEHHEAAKALLYRVARFHEKIREEHKIIGTLARDGKWREFFEKLDLKKNSGEKTFWLDENVGELVGEQPIDKVWKQAQLEATADARRKAEEKIAEAKRLLESNSPSVDQALECIETGLSLYLLPKPLEKKLKDLEEEAHKLRKRAEGALILARHAHSLRLGGSRKLREAWKAVQEALSEAPWHPAVAQEHRSTAEALARLVTEEFEVGLEQAVRLMDLGHWEDARAALDRADEVAAECRALLEASGSLEDPTPEFRRTAQALRDGLARKKKQSDDVDDCVKRCGELIGRKQFDAAETLYKEIPKEFIGKPLVAELRARLDDCRDEEEIFQKADAALREERWADAYSLGESLGRRGSSRGTREGIRICSQAQAGEVLQKADTLLKQGALREAEERLERAHRLDPEGSYGKTAKDRLDRLHSDNEARDKVLEALRRVDDLPTDLEDVVRLERADRILRDVAALPTGSLRRDYARKVDEVNSRWEISLVTVIEAFLSKCKDAEDRAERHRLVERAKQYWTWLKERVGSPQAEDLRVDVMVSYCLNCADTFESQNNAVDARKWLEEALRIAGDHPAAASVRTRLGDLMAPWALRDASRLVGDGKPEDALRHLESFAQEYPQYGEVYAEMARIEMRRNRFPQARQKAADARLASIPCSAPQVLQDDIDFYQDFWSRRQRLEMRLADHHPEVLQEVPSLIVELIQRSADRPEVRHEVERWSLGIVEARVDALRRDLDSRIERRESVVNCLEVCSAILALAPSDVYALRQRKELERSITIDAHNSLAVARTLLGGPEPGRAEVSRRRQELQRIRAVCPQGEKQLSTQLGDVITDLASLEGVLDRIESSLILVERTLVGARETGDFSKVEERFNQIDASYRGRSEVQEIRRRVNKDRDDRQKVHDAAAQLKIAFQEEDFAAFESARQVLMTLDPPDMSRFMVTGELNVQDPLGSGPVLGLGRLDKLLKERKQSYDEVKEWLQSAVADEKEGFESELDKIVANRAEDLEAAGVRLKDLQGRLQPIVDKLHEFPESRCTGKKAGEVRVHVLRFRAEIEGLLNRTRSAIADLDEAKGRLDDIKQKVMERMEVLKGESPWRLGYRERSKELQNGILDLIDEGLKISCKDQYLNETRKARLLRR